MEELAPFSYAQDICVPVRLYVVPARSAVISWNTHATNGTLRFRLLRERQPATSWFEYAQWSSSGRTSFSASSEREDVRVDVDTITAVQPFDGIELDGDGVVFDLLAVSTPMPCVASQPHARDAMILDVPARSQYVAAAERGWCSPASLAMVHAYYALDGDVAATARAVMDRAYNGTGNWSFNTAYSGSLGLRAVVAHLANLDHAARLIERGIPLVISYAWSGNELPGAPLEHSAGHLAVLRGFTGDGDCAVNDPAAQHVSVVYPREALEAVWQRAGGIAYVIAPAGKAFFDVLNRA